MIKFNTKTISSVYFGEKIIEKIYKGTLKVFESWRDLIASRVPLTLMKCKGVDLLDYKIHGDSVQNGTPTPDTPIEIQSVGDKTKNILPLYGEHSYTTDNLTLKIEGNTITLDGSIKVNSQWGIYQENNELKAIVGVVGVERNTPNLTRLKAGNYTITAKYLGGSFDTVSGGLYWGLYTYKNKTNILDTRAPMRMYDSIKKFTIDNDTDVQFLVLQFTGLEDGITFNNYKIKVQLEEGPTSTDIEPYGYKIPVKVSGKNLLNKDKAEEGYFIHVSGEKRASAGYGLKVTEKIPINPSKNYFYSGMGDVSATTVTRTGYQYDKNDNPIKALSGSDGKGVYFTPEPNCAYVLLQYVKTEEQPMFYEYYINVSDDYEPYVEPIITNIYLNEPLRKIENYIDYLDFKKGKIFRNVKEVRLTGNESWDLLSTGNIYQMYTNNLKLNGKPISSCASNITSYGVTTDDRMNFGLGTFLVTNGTEIAFQLKGWTTTMSIDEWKEYLKANNIEAHYILNKPVEETIELPNIPTIKGTTIIEVDTEIQPSYMEVVYKGK